MAEKPPKIPPRKKPPPKKDTKHDIYIFDTHEEGYTMPEFFDMYSERLPVFAMVTQGCLGLTDLETFSVEQTMFCHTYVKQTRVVARDAQNRTISIPQDYDVKFKMVISRHKVGGEQSLEEILSQNKLPLQVQFSVPDDAILQIDSDKRKAKDLTNLLLLKTYEEIFFVANGVYGKTLELNPMIVPLYLKDLQVSTVKGVVGMPDKEWKSLYQYLESELKNVKMTKNMGNKDIALYSESLSGDSDDHIYQYIEPTQYISFANFFAQNKTDDEKYTNPRFHKRQQGLISELHQKLDINAKDASSKGHQSRHVNRSISEPGRKPSAPPELPPRTTSFIQRSKRMLAESGATAKGKHTTRENLRLEKLTITDFSQILKQLRLGKYIDKFKKHQVDGALAKDLSEDILKEEFHMTEFEVIKFIKFTQTGHIPK